VSTSVAASTTYDFAPGPRIVEKSSRAKRARRAFVRYLIAIGLGVAATLGWQSYGDTIKQTIATKAPQLAWSPEMREQISTWIDQVGWNRLASLQGATPETIAAATGAPGALQPASTALSNAGTPDQPAAGLAPLLGEVQQIAADLATLRQDLVQLSTTQDETAHEVAKLEATSQNILNRVAAPLPQAAAVPLPKHMPPSPSAARPPVPLH
jgi:hypothetical protein